MAKNELESKLQRRCQQIIKDNGAFVFKNHGNMFTRAGLPDLIASVPVSMKTLQKMIADGWFTEDRIGIFVSFELKRENRLNELSTAQEIVGREIQNAGGIWMPTDDSDVVQALIKTMRGEL